MNLSLNSVRQLINGKKIHYAVLALLAVASLLLAYLFSFETLSLGLALLATGLLLHERRIHAATMNAKADELSAISRRFHLALDSSDIGLWEIDSEGSCYIDERSARLHGLSVPQAKLSLSSWLSTVLPEDRQRTLEFLLNSAQSGDTFSQTYRVLQPDGNIRHLRAAGASHIHSTGTWQTTGIILDVTADTLMAQTLKESKYSSDVKNAELELALHELSAREHDLLSLSRRLELALESYNCGTWEADIDNNTAYWDVRMHQLYGLPFQKDGFTTRQMWLNCMHPDDRRKAEEAADAAVRRNEALSSVHRILLENGDIRYVRSVGQIHIGRNGARKITGISFDVTADHKLAAELQTAKEEAEARNVELSEAKSRIEYNALHDPLTGLANRRHLDQELDLMSENARLPGSKRFAILHLDLDRFKQINDTLGHAAGDAMLVHAAGILRNNVGKGDVVARIGGDEFVILSRNARDREEVGAMAASIIAAFKSPFDFEGFTCRCGVSIGVAFGDSHSSDARKLLINADLALYRAKASGRNRCEFFTENLQAEIVSHKRLMDETLSGLENHEFETWYQPQFCSTTGRIAGMEALIRWRHPTRGLLTPDKFLKIAEELNVVQELDRIVLHTAVQDRRIWSMKGIDIPRVSVNVSLRRLHDEHLAESLRELAIQSGEVTFELVESIFLDDNDEKIVQNIERIKALGVDIEIDDFGTGHTSLISLLRLKPKRLKIDRQLVMPILSSPQERALVRSIIDIARSLGVETIAEGVETNGHADMLRQMGCDLLQGYAFAQPLQPTEFVSFVRDFTARDDLLKTDIR